MINDKPLVSIITPCYNSQNYIKRYLDNILSQTYSNIELILVNDGSTDATENIILSYKERFEARGYRYVYIRQENKGLGGAINTALKYISGEYFTWCDSDNFYIDDYVSQKVNFFEEHPEYSIVRCDGYVVNDSDIYSPRSTMCRIKKQEDKFKEHIFENCLYIKNFHFGCAMLRTADFDKVNPQRYIYPSRHGQNWQLLLPMFYHYKSGYIDKPMFYFVYREQSVSNCVKTQGLDAIYNQTEEYSRIISKTLDFMNIPEGEKYKRNIAIKYSNQRLCIASENRDKSRLDQEKEFLIALGAFDNKSKKIYRDGVNSFFHSAAKTKKFFKKVAYKLRQLLKK